MASNYKRTSPIDYRPLHISYEGLARVDGSARFSFGTSPHALASTSGPIEVRLASEHPSQATLDVLIRPLSNVPSTESKSLGVVVKNTIEKSLILTRNPRTGVQIVGQSLSPSGGSGWSLSSESWSTTGSGESASTSWATTLEKDTQIATLINACTLSLLNAGSIPMRGVVLAVPVAKTSRDGILVDPCLEDFTVDSSDPAVPQQQNTLLESGCFAFMFTGPSDSTCVWSSWRGVANRTFELQSLEEAKEVARVAVRRIYGEVKASLGGVLGVEDEEAMET